MKSLPISDEWPHDLSRVDIIRWGGHTVNQHKLQAVRACEVQPHVEHGAYWDLGPSSDGRCQSRVLKQCHGELKPALLIPHVGDSAAGEI